LFCLVLSVRRELGDELPRDELCAALFTLRLEELRNVFGRVLNLDCNERTGL